MTEGERRFSHIMNFADLHDALRRAHWLYVHGTSSEWTEALSDIREALAPYGMTVRRCTDSDIQASKMYGVFNFAMAVYEDE